MTAYALPLTTPEASWSAADHIRYAWELVGEPPHTVVVRIAVSTAAELAGHEHVRSRGGSILAELLECPPNEIAMTTLNNQLVVRVDGVAYVGGGLACRGS